MLAAGLLLYGWLWRGGPGWGGDTPSYLDAARDLVDFRWDRLHLRVPGYPLFLRVVAGPGAPGYRLVLAQLALYAVAVWSLASLLAGSGVARAGVLAFVTACWLPHVVQAAGTALSESLTQSLLMLGFAALARAVFLDGKRLALVGASVAFGYLAVTRPVYQATAPTLAALLGLVVLMGSAGPSRARLLRAAAVLPIGTIVLAGSLAFYQQSRFGAPASPAAAIALAAQTAAYVEALPAEEPLRQILVRHRDAHLAVARHHRPEGYIFRAWPELVAHFDGDERRTTREVTRLSRLVIRREPRAYLLQVWRSFARYWEWISFAVPGLRAPGIVAPLLLVHFTTAAIFWALLGSFVVVGAWVAVLPQSVRGRWRVAEPTASELGTFALAAAAVLLHMLLQCALGVGEPRYRLPSEPLVILAVTVAISFLCRARRGLTAGPGAEPVDRPS
ncbi:MAG: hypothetical protein ACRD0X_07840 [Thermoanaerobaculia bacterium]